jgi:arylsulfatase A-like enzyme
MTSLPPNGHGVRDNVGHALGAEPTTLAERFAAAGYDTAAFVGGYPVTRVFGLDRGFGHYDDRMTDTPSGAVTGHVERNAPAVVDATIAWIDAARRPFFVWVHLFDPHDPYTAPAELARRHDHPYDAEVAFTDDALGRLFARVLRSGEREPWIVVTADHGEALGEHGEPTHGVFLYEATLRVPLVIRPPGGMDPASVGENVSLLDVAPTLLDVTGLDPLPTVAGRSLAPMLSGRAPEPAGPLYLESVHGRRKYGWSPLYGLVDAHGRWKLIDGPAPELYDLAADGDERSNLYPREPALDLRDRLARERRKAATARDVAPAEVDVERLATLGYVGGSAGASSPDALDDRPRPDPKQRIAALPDIERGLAALRDDDLHAAETALRSALAIDPDNLVAWNNLGIAAMRGGSPEAAERAFREGLDRDAGADELSNNLGIALARQGRDGEAADAFRRALDVRPEFLAARFNLALALHRQGLHAEALDDLERVRVADPGFPEIESTLRAVRAAAER